MNGIKPVYVNQTVNSHQPHQQLNHMQITSPQSLASAEQSNSNISVSSIKIEAVVDLAHDEKSIKEGLKVADEYWAFQRRAKNEAKTMLEETQNVLDDIAQEQPSLLNKEFDFTHNGEEIEVIDHNLSKKEYNYLKAKLNANEELVEATDFLNLSAANKNTSTRDDDRLYTKEDIAGRIHVMDVVKQAQARTAEYIRRTTPGVISETTNGISYLNEDHLNALNILNKTTPAFSTRA